METNGEKLPGKEDNEQINLRPREGEERGIEIKRLPEGEGDERVVRGLLPDEEAPPLGKSESPPADKGERVTLGLAREFEESDAVTSQKLNLWRETQKLSKQNGA